MHEPAKCAYCGNPKVSEPDFFQDVRTGEMVFVMLCPDCLQSVEDNVRDQKRQREREKKRAKLVLWIGVTLIFGPLVVVAIWEMVATVM
jgi:hypothetical protein